MNTINNSRAVYEPFISTSKYESPLSVLSRYLDEMQSSSITPSGFLWLQTLARMAYETPLPVSQSGIKKEEPHQSVVHSERNRALIQLLRSWREADEQEQRNTWEYLRQALDEDRLSERKLFP